MLSLSMECYCGRCKQIRRCGTGVSFKRSSNSRAASSILSLLPSIALKEGDIVVVQCNNYNNNDDGVIKYKEKENFSYVTIDPSLYRLLLLLFFILNCNNYIYIHIRIGMYY